MQLVNFKDIYIQPQVIEDINYLVNSERRYEHLRAVNVTAFIPELLKFISNQRRHWKTIIIFRTTFGTRSQIEDVFRISSKTIEKLELFHVWCKDNLELSSSSTFNFPQLQHLRIVYHHIDTDPWINCYIASVPKLISITLGNAGDSQMKQLILNATCLKNLSLFGKFQDSDFFNHLSETLPPRLEEFTFNDILSSSHDDFNLSFFNCFFKSQSNTLKRFETDALLEPEELSTAFKMKNLHTLKIKSFDYNRETIRNHIDSLIVTEIPEASLKVFIVQIMDQNLLELLALHARGLEELRAQELHATNVSNPTWFPKLQKVQVNFFNPEISDQLGTKAENERTHFEQLLLDED
ncbi:CLUMA_CG012014, isoform B [Clunio marinus]|uniref:CLUMA_CG012014, isoform B n=1 Tax=Clunio marinus TaxID=568069 RepID=A0A1J1IFS2_9DIPT|nr:CLUMA_CG012014, isoform B [Clunio marinus]